jgi:hypothetical protein
MAPAFQHEPFKHEPQLRTNLKGYAPPDIDVNYGERDIIYRSTIGLVLDRQAQIRPQARRARGFSTMAWCWAGQAFTDPAYGVDERLVVATTSADAAPAAQAAGRLISRPRVRR